MSARTILLSDVIGDLTGTVLVNDSVPAEIIQIQDVKAADVVISSDLEISEYQTVSVGVKRRKKLSQTINAQFDIDENETDVIDAVDALDYGEGEMIFTTDEGGDNGTGKTFTITGADLEASLVEGHKTRFVIQKTTKKGTLPYSVDHVAA